MKFLSLGLRERKKINQAVFLMLYQLTLSTLKGMPCTWSSTSDGDGDLDSLKCIEAMEQNLENNHKIYGGQERERENSMKEGEDYQDDTSLLAIW